MSTRTATRPHDNDGIEPFLRRSGVCCEVERHDGAVVPIGSGEPAFRVRLRTPDAHRTPLTEWAIGHAYITGKLDFEGDLRALLDLRNRLPIGIGARDLVTLVRDVFLRSPRNVNRSAIDEHYTLGDDFYLTFIDERYRFYSHCLFHDDGETLEEAAEHKLESMWNALGLRPGMRLLDIGGGWGGVAQYCTPRGVHVTSVTLVEDSANHIRARAARENLDVDVVHGDFLDYVPDEPFDHAVIYGVIEHIPNYGRFCDAVWRALKPGGRLYMDGSATKEKYAMSPVTRAFTWTGHHTFLSLQGIIQELLFRGFEIAEVKHETRDYELTITHWAERFERNRQKIVERWGEQTFRAFRVFLWGGSHAFATDRLQAYHLVAVRRDDPGPRPGLLRRFGGFLASLR